MILSVVMCAITTVVATGFQVAGMCIPMWWTYKIHDRHYYCGLFKIPWKICHEGRCTVIATDGEMINEQGECIFESVSLNNFYSAILSRHPSQYSE